MLFIGLQVRPSGRFIIVAYGSSFKHLYVGHIFCWPTGRIIIVAFGSIYHYILTVCQSALLSKKMRVV